MNNCVDDGCPEYDCVGGYELGCDPLIADVARFADMLIDVEPYDCIFDLGGEGGPNDGTINGYDIAPYLRAVLN